MNTYQPEWNYGPAFFDVRHNFVLSAKLRAAVRDGAALPAAQRPDRRLEA